MLLPKSNKKPPRVNTSLLREMWRTAASLELLPLQTKTDLGEALLKRLKSADAGPSDLWCISRIGARKLLYGPNNQVLSPGNASKWIDALLRVKGSEEALASIAQHTGDASRDVPAATLNLVRRAVENKPELLSLLDGESPADGDRLGRIFGEELPAGLVFAND